MTEAQASPLSINDALVEALRAHGTSREVGANRPVELVGDVAWYVEAGNLDVFVQQHSTEVLGRRTLLCSATTGTLVWSGGDAEVPEGWRLLAVGHAGTQLLNASGDALREHVEVTVVAAHVEAFVSTVTAGNGAGSTLVEPAQDAHGRAASTPAEELSAEELDARIVDARRTFGAVVRAAIERSTAQDAVDAERLATLHDHQHQLLDAALADLIEVVDRREPLTTAPADQLAQLDVALARLGRSLGIEFGGELPLDEADDDPVHRRLAAAGCRARTVTLSAGWWTRPGLGLLGFLREGDRPVALLPGRRGYELFDPATGSTRRVDASVADLLAPRAYTIYRPLPASVHSARSLLSAAMPGLRREVWLLLALGALAGLITLLTPLVTSMIYDSVLPTGDRSLLIAVTSLLLGAAITWGLVSLSQNLFMVRISGRLQANLDPAMMDRLLQLPAQFFRRYDTGDLATRAGGLQIIRMQLSGTVVTSFLTLLFSVFNVALLFIYSPLLGAVAAGILILVAAVLVPLNLGVIRHQKQVYDATGDVASDLFQVVQAVHKLRTAAAEPRLMTRWANRFRVQQRENYAAGRVQAWIFAIIAALPAILAFGLYAVAGTVLVGEISTGDFIGLTTALGQFTAALIGVALSIGPVLTVIPLWRRLMPIIEEPVEEIGTGAAGTLSGAISLRDISFSYDDDAPPVLQHVSMDVRPGEFVAITGPSGSGKSTLLRLLLGLDRPSSGTIFYDGKDLNSLDARAVRRQIGVVMQGARPLPGEILTTILGDAPGDEEDAWRAAEAAELAADIRRMPMRMHTIIGEGGLAFSGGQVQRMMIARSLARRPRLIFLDEATSALDDRVQAAVSEHISALRTTRVVIAHRLSTIRNADRIFVLEAGQVVEAGTFDDLMDHDGPFRRLAARQLV